MAKKGKLTDKDKGYKGLFRRIHIAARGCHVKVGILGDDAAKPHAQGLGAADKDRLAHAQRLAKGGFKSSKVEVKRLKAKAAESSLTVGEIGEIHELGLGHNPVRSWLRGYVDANRSSISKRIKRVAEAVEKGALTAEQGMDQLGLSLVGGIRSRISSGIAPQVTDATQARKGSSKTTPLINSGQFRSSISHRVDPGP